MLVRRSASPPLPGQGQGASAFKRPRSASPSDAGFWHQGLPFAARPLGSAPLRKPGDRDVESSASQREYGPQRSGSSSSEDDRARRLPPRDDADATSGVQPGGRGASSSSSDENAGSRSSGGEMADSSSSDKRRHEVSRASSAAHRGGPESGPNRVGAMLPPPPRQPKRLSLPPASIVEGAPGHVEGSLSGESCVAHNSSDLALAAAASSSTGHTAGQEQVRPSWKRKAGTMWALCSATGLRRVDYNFPAISISEFTYIRVQCWEFLKSALGKILCALAGAVTQTCFHLLMLSADSRLTAKNNLNKMD